MHSFRVEIFENMFYQDLIDLDTLEQLERDFNADENASSDDSPVPKPAPSPPLKGV